jgi:uncharacterized membrane protein YgaE (UPF0421/DUF939 family)
MTEKKRRVWDQTYKEKNKDTAAANREAYNEKNKEVLAAYQRTYYQKHKERKIAYSKEYYRRNKETMAHKSAGYSKKYRERNKEVLAARRKAARLRRCGEQKNPANQISPAEETVNENW